MNRTLLLVLLSAWSLPATAEDQSTAGADDPLRLAAEDAAGCRELRNPDVRLACLDAVAQRLAIALSSTDQATSGAEAPPKSPDAPKVSAAVEPSVEAAADDSVAVEPSARAASDVSVAVESSGEAAEDSPDWASAPEEPEPEPAEMPRRFEATIVRITSNNVGRHRFYTADGAIWEQTQITEVRRPRSLPTVAEFRRRLTGNPTISFDVSNRSYRVRRIE